MRVVEVLIFNFHTLLTLVFGSRLVSPFLGVKILDIPKIGHFWLPTNIDRSPLTLLSIPLFRTFKVSPVMIAKAVKYSACHEEDDNMPTHN